jgi:hypothetical protein
MNELYEQTIQHQGKTYRYDPDRDVFYREQQLSRWDRIGWLVVIAALTTVVLYFEFWPIR